MASYSASLLGGNPNRWLALDVLCWGLRQSPTPDPDDRETPSTRKVHHSLSAFFALVYGMLGSRDVSLPAQSAESLWGHLFIWPLWVTFPGFELGWRQGSHLVPKQPSLYRCQSDPIFGSGAKATQLYRCQSDPIFGSGAKATQSDVPRIRTWVATRLLPLLLPSCMSSRRLLIEPGGAVCEGSLPTRVTGGRAACPCKVGELEGSECASSDMVSELSSWRARYMGVYGSCGLTLHVSGIAPVVPRYIDFGSGIEFATWPFEC
ncbi:hypothetical protein AAG906_034108 [Vitis piasezkii]